jgi:hypothetical protein
LSEFLCKAVEGRAEGIFCPQDDELANTAELIKGIRAKLYGKKTLLFRAKIFLRVMMIFPPVKTAFASLYYDSKDKVGLSDFLRN